MFIGLSGDESSPVGADAGPTATHWVWPNLETYIKLIQMVLGHSDISDPDMTLKKVTTQVYYNCSEIFLTPVPFPFRKLRSNPT